MRPYKISRLTSDNMATCIGIQHAPQGVGLAKKWEEEIRSGNRVVFLYQENEKCIGELALVFDQRDADYTINGQRIHLSHLFVAPDCRRRGVASRLIDHAVGRVSILGFKELSVGVDVDNEAAGKLYEKKGFSIIIGEARDEQGRYVKLLKSIMEPTVTILTAIPQRDKPRFVVIAARSVGQWILARHKQRETLELPGGRIEAGESVEAAARRELFEETGATKFSIHFVTYYCVETEGNEKSYGALFFADVKQVSSLPDYEIAETVFLDYLPENLTYPTIQPKLYETVQFWLNRQSAKDERWDIYDENRGLKGYQRCRGDLLEAGEYHLVVHVWVQNERGEYLVTKRSPNKGYPNMWECIGGSAVAGDDSRMAALRELQEETGIALSEKQGTVIHSYRGSDYFCDVWKFQADFPIEEVVLQTGETCDARWATVEEIAECIKRKQFFLHNYLPSFLYGELG